ncbi:uncharacterized protein LOC112685299 [Sipha flava]|uniref:Uncharacterized protein LOC112685299 n=2 Tax=Sipha flava TaxID=143950 RepID=A0A8B8FR00_9HEMI|nr:uncharacterized protein LOC112685299 [Sipha flava]
MCIRNHAFVYPLTTSRSSEHHMEDTVSREIDDLVLRFQKLSLNDCETNQTVRSTVLQRNDAFNGVSSTLSHPYRYPLRYIISEDHIEDLILRFKKLSLNDGGNGQTVTSSVLQRNDVFVDALTANRVPASRETTSDMDIEDLIIQFQKLSLNDNGNSQTITSTDLQRNGALIGTSPVNRLPAYPARETTSEDIDDLILRFQKLSLNDSKDVQTVTKSVLRGNLAFVDSTALTTILAPQTSEYHSGSITMFKEIEDLTKLRFQQLSSNFCGTNQIDLNTILLKKSEVFVSLFTMNLSFECPMSGKIKDLIQQFKIYHTWCTNGSSITRVSGMSIIEILSFV